MLSKVLTVVFLLSLVACNKEYKKSDNHNISTIESLNSGDYQSVIDKSSSKKNLSSREKYYLASAYAMSGGVDVFSLYSVIEIQLFHKRALDWSDLSKDKNPYLKFMKNQEGIDFEKRQTKKEERWVKYLPKLKIKYGIEERKTYEEVKNYEYCYCSDLTIEQFNQATTKLDALAAEILAKDISIDEFDDAWYDLIYNQNPEASNNPAFNTLQNDYWSEVYLSFQKKRYLNPSDKSQDAFGDVQWEMLYMNILWNTYEAIPLMKKLPNLSDTQQENVSKSLEEYVNLLKDKEFKDVSLKNLMILSGVSLLSIYKGSFDLDEVSSIQDLYCSFEPVKILDNYGLIRKRVLFLQEAYEKSGINSEDYEKYKSKLELFKQSLPVDLTEQQKARFLESVDKFKVDSCFNG
jgi:hypothetical protein